MSGGADVILVFVVVAVSVAGALLYRSYRSEQRHARAEIAAGGRVVRTAAGVIEYAEHGDGAPLLSIHGAGGGYDQGLANAAELVGDEFRVVAPSRFGYLGTTVPEDASVAAQAEAHVALLDALKIDKTIVVGVSAGARSAIELTLRHPDRVTALLLIVPGTYTPTSPVMIDSSRASKFTFWLVNQGAQFAWWLIERTAPSVLIRFLGVPPEVFCRCLKERAGARSADREECPAPVLTFPGHQSRQRPGSPPSAA